MENRKTLPSLTETSYIPSEDSMYSYGEFHRIPYYPKMDLVEYVRSEGPECILKTLVRIKRDRLWYKIPCQRSVVLPTLKMVSGKELHPSNTIKLISELYKSIIAMCQNVQYLYVVDPDYPGTKDMIDDLQIEESERLRMLQKF